VLLETATSPALNHPHIAGIYGLVTRGFSSTASFAMITMPNGGNEICEFLDEKLPLFDGRADSTMGIHQIVTSPSLKATVPGYVTSADTHALTRTVGGL
jgi:hypothetical protein